MFYKILWAAERGAWEASAPQHSEDNFEILKALLPKTSLASHVKN